MLEPRSPSDVKAVLDFSGQLLLDGSQLVTQPLHYPTLIGVAIPQLVSQTFEIGFVKLPDFDFGEFDFSFIVIDYLLHFIFELVVGLDELQPVLFVDFNFFNDVEQYHDFSLLCGDDYLQSGDLAVVVLLEVGFVLGLGLGVGWSLLKGVVGRRRG